jgi:SET domain-containing protein
MFLKYIMGKTKKRKPKKRNNTKKNNKGIKKKRRTWSSHHKFIPKYINLAGKRIMDNPADYDLEVKKSKIHGYGVFTKIPFKKDQAICPYNHMKSQVMDWKKFVKKYGEDFRFTYSLKAFGNNKIINLKKHRNLVCFINDNRPYHNVYLAKRGLKARRNIKAGEELTLSYPHYDPKGLGSF